MYLFFKSCSPCIVRVDEVDDGVVLDFRLVLPYVGRQGGSGGVVHVLQGLQGNGLAGYAGAVAAVGLDVDVLLHHVGASVLHEIAERGFGHVEALHAVVVEYGKLDLDELVPGKYAGDGSLHSLAGESRHRAVEVSAFPQLGAAHRHVVKQLEAL